MSQVSCICVFLVMSLSNLSHTDSCEFPLHQVFLPDPGKAPLSSRLFKCSLPQSTPQVPITTCSQSTSRYILLPLTRKTHMFPWSLCVTQSCWSVDCRMGILSFTANIYSSVSTYHLFLPRSGLLHSGCFFFPSSSIHFPSNFMMSLFLTAE